MKRFLLVSTALVLGFSSQALAQDEDAVSLAETAPSAAWGYTGTTAAAYWGTLNSSYDTCVSGQSQSPINISEYLQETNMPALEPGYVDSGLSVYNNGKTVEVNFDEGSYFTNNGQQYNLLKLTFHTPSEHYLDGAPYPMEAQFVHQTESGSVGIVSVMLKLGAHNPVIEGIWQNAPITAGETKEVGTVKINAGALMPQSLSHYHYTGSLTTPPCTEGVEWFVMKDTVELSETQLKAFQALFPVNARPIQPLNDRVVSGN